MAKMRPKQNGGGSVMMRRSFLAGVGSAAVAWPLAALAQSTDRVRRIGVLMQYREDDPEGQTRRRALEKGLEQRGWTIGGNLRIDYRWSPGNAAETRKFGTSLSRSRRT